MADTDGDGFDDPDEIAQGTDPNNPLDYPGGPAVPALSDWGVTLLIGAMLFCAVFTTRFRTASATRQ